MTSNFKSTSLFKTTRNAQIISLDTPSNVNPVATPGSSRLIKPSTQQSSIALSVVRKPKLVKSSMWMQNERTEIMYLLTICIDEMCKHYAECCCAKSGSTKTFIPRDIQLVTDENDPPLEPPIVECSE